MDILFPVNRRTITGPPKMSLLLAAQITPVLIIKPGLILVPHTDDLSWYIKSNQLAQMFVQNHYMIVSKPNVTPGKFMYCITDCIPIDLMFQESVPTNTQVGTAWAIEMAADSKEWSDACYNITNLKNTSQTLKTSISQQPHSNLGWWGALTKMLCASLVHTTMYVGAHSARWCCQ